MKLKRFTDEQIAFALRQAESGVAAKEVCRKLQGAIREPWTGTSFLPLVAPR